MAKKRKGMARNKSEKPANETIKKRSDVHSSGARCSFSRNPALILAGVLIAVLAVFLSYLAISGSGSLSSPDSADALTSTLKSIEKIDLRYGISIDDYSWGIIHLRYNPRFPNPLNAADFPPIIEQFAELLEGLEEGTPEMLIVESRIHLLESEKLFKMAVRTSKGLTDKSFSCNDAVHVQAATINFQSSIDHGRSAVDKLNYLVVNHYDLANQKLDIRSKWIDIVNQSYDDLEQYSLDNRRRFESMCNITLDI